MKYSKKQLVEAISYLSNQLVLEDKKAFLKKFANEPDVLEITDYFWNNVRSRANGKYKDIEYWYKRPFSEFRQFVNNFNMTSKKQQHAQDDIDIRFRIENEGATLLGRKDGYEIWHIEDYEAAKLLGRDYKRRWAKWCISSDDPEFWFENYDRAEFVFLIREEPQNDEFDKVAIEFEDGGHYFNVDQITTWDLNNNDNTYMNDDMIRYAWELFIDSGLKKKRYY